VEDDINIHAYLQTRSTFKRTLEGAVHSSFTHSMLMKGRSSFPRYTLQGSYLKIVTISAPGIARSASAGRNLTSPRCKGGEVVSCPPGPDYSFFWIMKTLDSRRASRPAAWRSHRTRVVLQAMKHNRLLSAVSTPPDRRRRRPQPSRGRLKAIQTYLCERTPSSSAHLSLSVRVGGVPLRHRDQPLFRTR